MGRRIANEATVRDPRAAQQLFSEGGYAVTSVRSIAERAGVAEQTVYNAYGDKPSMLRGVIERVVVRHEPDRRRRLTILVGMTRQAYERGAASLADLLLEGAAIDDGLARLVHALEAQRYGEMQRGINAVLGDDDAPKGWTVDELVNLV